MKIPETYEELESTFIYNPDKKWWKRGRGRFILIPCHQCGEECFVVKGKYEKRHYSFCDGTCTGAYHKGEGNPMHGMRGDKSPLYKGGVDKVALYGTYAHQLPSVIEVRETDEGHLEWKCGGCGDWCEPTRSKVVNKIATIKHGATTLLNYYCCNKCRYGSDEYKESSKINARNKQENNSQWNGGYAAFDIPVYDVYHPLLSPYEDTRRNPHDNNVLQVRCTYCDEWHTPKRSHVRTRISCINGERGGEHHFYCSDECKQLCPTYGRATYPKGFINPNNTVRYDQPALRKLVLERDNNTCQRCHTQFDPSDLVCHHIDPVVCNPIESADMDNCMTLCKKCDKEVHDQDGCRYHELRQI